MKTLGDLYKFLSSAHVDMDLFGYSPEFEEAFRERCKAISSALCRERNTTPARGMELPPETLLGKKSKALAESMKTWFSLETAVKR